MFNENEVKDLIEKFDTDTIENNVKLKYINNKILKHGYLYININELNYLYQSNDLFIRYDVAKLRDEFRKHGIGYTSIIKNIGIPKATLSKLFTKDRNVKLEQLNSLFEKANKIYSLNLSKEIIEEGE